VFENNEEAIDHEGPYQCNDFNCYVALIAASNSAVLNSWVREHMVVELRFVHQSIRKCPLAAASFGPWTGARCVKKYLE